MHWYASSVMYPGVIRCFGSHNITHPCPGDPAGGDQAPTCVPVATHGSALLIDSHLVAFSAASLTEERQLRITLVGKTGVGKSAVGNTILGERAFESKLSPSPVTSKCEKKTGQFEGQSLAVVDTPGLFGPKVTEEEAKRQIAQCICFAAPGPHVFLIVIQTNRFTNEEQETVRIIQQMFGEEAAGYTIVLFTRGDDLQAERITIEELINCNKGLSEFISQCGGRHHVFNNRSTDPAQVRELLDKINTMVQINGGRHYINEKFEKAERVIREETRKLLRENPQMEPKDARRQAERDNSFIKWGILAIIGAAVVGAGVVAAAGVPNAVAGAVAVAIKMKACRIQ
uniref:AIG1-type G domain-containing protein n=1 Tax=Neolamprologus brichardi TaxID=32507 RepID=A0A3Q4NBT4_NEOBR